MFGRLNNLDKNLSSERQLVLKVMEGKKPLTSTGMVDSRVFSGDIKVYAVMDKQSTLWSVKYSSGNPPPLLKQSFTKYKDLYNFVKRYFNSRNIEIVEVKD